MRRFKQFIFEIFRAKKNKTENKLSQELVKIAHKIPTTGEAIIIKIENKYYRVKEVV